MTDSEEFQTIKTLMPHIAPKIELLWGHKECNVFISRLLMDTRDGTRQGFPHEVAKALTKLMLRHDEEFPQFIEKQTSPW